MQGKQLPVALPLANVAVGHSSGAALPMGLRRLGVDPSHSTTTIQVIMDCLGVVITVGVCYRLLG